MREQATYNRPDTHINVSCPFPIRDCSKYLTTERRYLTDDGHIKDQYIYRVPRARLNAVLELAGGRAERIVSRKRRARNDR